MTFFPWELVGDRTYRMKVPGGWIVRYENVQVEFDSRSGEQKDVHEVAMVFVPDANHEWGKVG